MDFEIIGNNDEFSINGSDQPTHNEANLKTSIITSKETKKTRQSHIIPIKYLISSIL